jgi:hypothetical protein
MEEYEWWDGTPVAAGQWDSIRLRRHAEAGLTLLDMTKDDTIPRFPGWTIGKLDR